MADSSGAATAAPPAAAEGLFPTLDQTFAGSGVQVQLAYSSYDTNDSFSALRLGLFGQISGPSGLGGYFSLSGSMVRGEDSEGNSDSESALGGLDVGGLWASRDAAGESIVRAGLGLATADADIPGLLTNYINSFARLTDAMIQLPETTWLRLSGSRVQRSGPWIFRADLGIDLPIDEAEGADVSGVLRFNAAAGWVGATSQWSLETVTLVTLNSDVSDQAIHTIGVSYRHLGQWQPFVGLYSDAGADGLLGSDLQVVVLAGVGSVR